ncbi:flagellar biosynthetic protein FliO [Neptuniibacter sp. QD48_11]|uniref:flagellar biosynthetic protein FliO n=1 Tax=unclassified Neptuniibacter TaxID=2630693 RepID=UPI0039F5BA5D
MRSWLLCLLVTISPSAFALGVETASGAKPSVVPVTSYQEPFSAAALTQLLLGLLFVIGMIFILSWCFRRFSGVTPMARHMKVLSVLPLSTREKAVLVQVGDKQLLLGVAPGRVSHLHAFDKPIVDDQSSESFAARLGEAISKRRSVDEAD